MIYLNNPFIMAPLKLGYASDGTVNPRHLEFYERRSRYLGAVTPEPLYLDPGLREISTQLGIDDDNKIPGLSSLVSLLHENGVRAIAHLNHPGRMANPAIPGNYFWSSSETACENGGATPESMDREMMDHVVGLFREAARRAEDAGFDFIELQFGHGYLLSQFLSPAVNDRNDEYNGNLENRSRFPLEVLNTVRQATPLPIMARISGDEMMPRGFHLEEMIRFSRMLEKNGAAAIHVSTGSTCSTPPWFFQHMFVPKGKTWEQAGQIKNEVNIPVIFVGQINDRNDISWLQKIYGAEYMAVGRALVADPDFVGKVRGKVKGTIRPCGACSEGCLGNVRKGKGLSCVVNPRVNHQLPEPVKTTKQEHIAIIGGGLAGMQAAIVLNERGYRVTLFEKNRLGGQFNLAWLPPGKDNLKKIVDYFTKEIRRLKIPVEYREATEEDIRQGAYDQVCMATGAVPVIPPVKGLKKYYWTEFLNDKQLPENETVLIVGGGLIALEVASKLIDGNNQVIIIEMLGEVGRGMEIMEKKYTLARLTSKGTQIYTNHRVVEIMDDRVFIESNKHLKTTIEGIDKIIVAAGMKSYVPFQIHDGIPVHTIGDARTVSKAEDALYSACEWALNL